jgi:hypothetical protein
MCQIGGRSVLYHAATSDRTVPPHSANGSKALADIVDDRWAPWTAGKDLI